MSIPTFDTEFDTDFNEKVLNIELYLDESLIKDQWAMDAVRKAGEKAIWSKLLEDGAKHLCKKVFIRFAMLNEESKRVIFKEEEYHLFLESGTGTPIFRMVASRFNKEI